MDLYTIIPETEHNTCGVIYVNVKQTGSDNVYTLRKSDVLLRNHMHLMSKKYNILKGDMAKLQSLIEVDTSQSMSETKIE